VIRPFFVMNGIMTKECAEMPNKPTENPKESAVMSATVRANEMLRVVCGPRGWNDTRESWLARGARAVGLSPRRARALFYQEPIRLSADEYIAIERAWEGATQAMAASDDLARNAAALADSAAQRGERQRLLDRAEALKRELAATDAALRQDR
jgi:hypothetical protein